MNKTLALIAVCGLILCGIFVGLAYGVSGGRLGPFAPFSNLFADDKPGPAGTRQWSLSGDSLEIDAPAIIRVSGPASGPTTLIVHGPQNLLDDMRFDDGRLKLDNDDHVFMHNQHLEITIQGAVPKSFTLNGFGKLELGHLDQDRLAIRISGAAEARGEGRADNLDVNISGAGNVKFGRLAARTAHVNISGAGNAEISATDEADVDLSGFGNVRLTTRPKKLVSHISGLGHVHNPGGSDEHDD